MDPLDQNTPPPPEEDEKPVPPPEVVEEPAEEVLDPFTHIIIEDLGPVEYADAASKPRIVTVNGERAEHVADHPSGIWIYRRM